MRTNRSRAVAAVAFATLVACVPAAAAKPKLIKVASGLDNPRKLFADPSGAIYVAEAGSGGTDKCLPPLARPTCVGLTGSIARIGRGTVERVVRNLPSVAGVTGQRAQGPADVIVRGGRLYVLVQGATLDARGRNDLGPDGAYTAKLLVFDAGARRPTVVADLAAYEAAHNPDRGVGRGARYGDPPIDSNPYALAPYRGGFAVADAGGNDLLWVDARGRISTLAVFPARRVAVDAATARAIGAPRGTRSILVQSVPTSVAVGPDGALYVGELTGTPFPRGLARIWRVARGEKPRVWASGFTTISDLVFVGRKLLVLEIAERGLLDPTSPGALIEVGPDGRRRTVLTSGLVAPTGIAVTRGGLVYVSNNTLFTGSGPGRHGELVRIG